jgi:hypothetical protein
MTHFEISFCGDRFGHRSGSGFQTRVLSESKEFENSIFEPVIVTVSGVLLSYDVHTVNEIMSVISKISALIMKSDKEVDPQES